MDKFIETMLEDIDKCANKIALNITAIKGYVAGGESAVQALIQQGKIQDCECVSADTQKEDKNV